MVEALRGPPREAKPFTRSQFQDPFAFWNSTQRRPGTARRSRNQTETPSTQRHRGRREPQSFFFNHGWTRRKAAWRPRRYTRINTGKGETRTQASPRRVSRIDANSVGDNSRNSCQTLCSPLSHPCESESIRGEKSSQKETMSWDSTAKTPRLGTFNFQPSTACLRLFWAA